MNKTQKIIFSVLVLAILAFSAAAPSIHALLTSNTISIAGSSTVLPIAQEAATTFPTYWNGLVTANPSWGTSAALDINTINTQGLGSGTAFSSILSTTGTSTADIGEMSRPPTTAEWGQSNAGNVQIWAVGVDSLAIVYSADMTWAPTQLTAKQVCQLFETTDKAGTTPIYNTWGDFFTAYTAAGGTLPAGASAHANDPITRIVRDPTSGTYDCFNNFFGKQLGNNAEATNPDGSVSGSQYMAPYTLAPGNPDVVTDLTGASHTIAFISLGYYLTNEAIMLPVSIYNASPPAPATPGYYAPSQANVIAGTYTPYRWLWEVTPNVIPTTGANLAEGVWIAYMKLDAGVVTVNGVKNTNFVSDNSYMVMPRAAMAGGHVLDSTLANYNPTSGQTQTVPRLTVDANDFFYFTDAYIAYYTQHTYDPYADITAQGKIDGSSFLAFLSEYVYYFTTYAPTHQPG